MLGKSVLENNNHISDDAADPEMKTIEDVESADRWIAAVIRFVLGFGLGVFFFMSSVRWQGQTTILLDVAITFITENFAYHVETLTLLLALYGGVLATLSLAHYRGLVPLGQRNVDRLELDYWETSSLFWLCHTAGALLVIPIFLGVGPEWLLSENTEGIVWGSLLLTIALVILIGTSFVNLLVKLGGLQFVGTLAQPIMNRLCDLSGRATLDSVASWPGSFCIGYYLTRIVFDPGGYNKREV